MISYRAMWRQGPELPRDTNGGPFDGRQAPPASGVERLSLQQPPHRMGMTSDYAEHRNTSAAKK